MQFSAVIVSVLKNTDRVFAHALDNEHFKINLENLHLVKEVNDKRKLNAYESYNIQKDGNAINLDNGNIASHLMSRLL